MSVNQKRYGSHGPELIVIGAMRAGTTSLFDLLRQTGRVAVPDLKETDFFLRENFHQDLDWMKSWYRSFDLPLVDVSPNYSKRDVFPGVPERIHSLCPDARLTYIVRDPVERCISHYIHKWSLGTEMPSPSDLLGSDLGEELISASSYNYQLEAYLKYWEAGDVQIVEFESLINDPQKVVQDMLKRLEIDDDLDEDLVLTRRNAREQLQRLPAVWGAMRRTRLWTFGRRFVPVSAQLWLKRVVRGLNAPNEVEGPQFSNRERDYLAERLAPDAEAFRARTGLTFPEWTV